MESDQYYVEVNGEKTGPFIRTVIAAKIAGGHIKEETLVWKDGMENWKPAGAVEDLAAAFAGAKETAEREKQRAMEALRKKAEEEERQRKAAEEAARQKAEEEQRKKEKAAEQLLKKAREEEQKRIAAEDIRQLDLRWIERKKRRKEERKRKRVIGFVITLLLVIAAVAVYYFFFR